MTKVNSTSIKEVDYNSRNHTMLVMFHSGDIYEYYEVPQNDYDGIFECESIGRYFNQQIKKNYGGHKISLPEPSAF